MRTIVTLCFLLIITITSGYSSDVQKDSNVLVGQWIWSSKDAKIFLETRNHIPDLVPCIWVSTITAPHGTVSQRLAISPSLAKSVKKIAIIVRIDDSLHQLWDVESPKKIAHDIDVRLAKLMQLLLAAGINVDEVQLDYDCPMRQLSAWARVVRTVAAGSLNGKQVWITSLPAHLDDLEYHKWFHDVIAGHILQLFDTGVSCNLDTFQRLSARLRRQDMPFRIGVGAFERVLHTGITDHQLWFSTLSAFAEIPGYQGVWIFPGGRKWLKLYSFHSTN